MLSAGLLLASIGSSSNRLSRAVSDVEIRVDTRGGNGMRIGITSHEEWITEYCQIIRSSDSRYTRWFFSRLRIT